MHFGHSAGGRMNRRKSIPAPVTPPGRFHRYGARVFDDTRHDPYQPPGKYAGPTRCATCGAVYQRGRWQWITAPASSTSATCPACRRAHDHLPAGRLTLQGPYVALHRSELVRLARGEERHERVEHALHRIIDVDERSDIVDITTTDIHLPRRIGEAVKRAHDGDLTISFAKDAYEIRVHWQR
jgi:hypothetical protein